MVVFKLQYYFKNNKYLNWIFCVRKKESEYYLLFIGKQALGKVL